MQKLLERMATWSVSMLSVVSLLLAPSLAKAGDTHEALVLICPRGDLAGCTITTARIFFKVRVESAIPSGCLALANAKAAAVSEMWDAKEEVPKISCGR